MEMVEARGSDLMNIMVESAVFRDYITKYVASNKNLHVFPSRETYDEIVSILSGEKTVQIRTLDKEQMRKVKKQFVLSREIDENIILHKNSALRILCADNLEAELIRVHDEGGHPGRDVTRKRLQEIYHAVPFALVSEYVKQCHICASLKWTSKRNLETIVRNTSGSFSSTHPLVQDSGDAESCDRDRSDPGFDSKILLDELYEIMKKKCEEKCDLCDKYILQLYEHVINHGDNASINTNSEDAIAVDVNVNNFLILEENMNIKLEPDEVEFNEETEAVTDDPLRLRHMESVSNESSSSAEKSCTYTCRCCEMKFSDKSKYENHFEIHEGEKPYKCGICEQSFPELHELNSHGTLCHLNQPSNIFIGKVSYTGDRQCYICDLCDESFVGPSNLKEHKLNFHTNTGEIKNNCILCGKDFEDSLKLEEHKLSCHSTGDKSMPYKCDICGTRFKFPSNLSKHSLVHSGQKPYKCERCGLSLSSLGNLNKHKKRKSCADTPGLPESQNIKVEVEEVEVYHEDQFIYNPDTESEIVVAQGSESVGIFSNDTPSPIPQSSVSISPITDESPDTAEEKSFTCRFCNIEFTLSLEYEKHFLIHNGEDAYKCEVCGKGFQRLYNVKRHSSTHTQVKPFKCNICGMEFRVRNYMNRHKATHTGEKRYKCDVCGKTFGHGSNLYQHKKLHKGEKPYKCEECGKFFSGKRELNNHSWNHTGQKLYSCEHCGKNLSSFQALRTHKKMQHE